MLNKIYSFIHDKVIECALELLSDKVDDVKFIMGCILFDRMASLDDHKTDQILFLVVNLLNCRLDTTPEDKAMALCDINTLAGDESYMAAAFRPAVTYYAAAIKLLPENHWLTMPDESLHLYTSAAEAEMCLGNYDKMTEYVQEVDKLDLPIERVLPIYEVNMDALAAMKKVPEALEACRRLLGKLGVHFPTSGIKARTIMALQNLKHSKKWKPAALRQLQKSDNPIDAKISKIYDRKIEYTLMVRGPRCGWSRQVEKQFIYSSDLLTIKVAYASIILFFCKGPPKNSFPHNLFCVPAHS